MSSNFEDQGGVASMDPSPVVRWIGSRVMTRMADLSRRERQRQKEERARQKAGAPHVIEYFHQAGDGYSHLAAQLLTPLLEKYNVQLVCHLVTEERGRNLPEPDLLLAMSISDSARVATHYGLNFPAEPAAPDDALSTLASRILAAASAEEFPQRAVAAGALLHARDVSGLEQMAAATGALDIASTRTRAATGNERRSRLGHYSGAMFYYGGEWYWGADRFYHLENRLLALGARKDHGRNLICPRPVIETGPLTDTGSLTLEIYPSLRSPYTSAIFDKTLELAEATGVKLLVRPVLPMVMRGVPATRHKGMYIVADTAREAQALGVAWGRKIYDPIGQPVRNAYSLYPWARDQGVGNAFLSSFMRAAFCEGVNTSRPAGMRTVVERAGLSWPTAQTIMGNQDWQDELEVNRLAMYEFGSWGVPSFRLLDASGEEVLALWGQDRLWLFAAEIQRLLGERHPE